MSVKDVTYDNIKSHQKVDEGNRLKLKPQPFGVNKKEGEIYFLFSL